MAVGCEKVIRIWTLTAPCGRSGVYRPVAVPGNYSYQFVNDFVFAPANKWLLFEVQISNDAHIALTVEADNYDDENMYEIVIGGWSNSQSVIR